MQDALMTAMQQWPFRGVPGNPEAWLFQVARNCARDAIDSREALDRYPLLPAIQAELWREAGDAVRAAECYRTALGRARSAPEQRWLTSRLSLLV